MTRFDLVSQISAGIIKCRSWLVLGMCVTKRTVTVIPELLQAVRVVVFAVCYPFLKYTGYSITLRKATVCVWAGLRGAVGLALSMFLLFDGQVSDRSFRLLAFFFMGMIAAITILVQGTTTGLLLQVIVACIPFSLETVDGYCTHLARA